MAVVKFHRKRHRAIFVDTPTGMLSLDCMLNIRDGEDQTYLSILELEQLVHLRARANSTVKPHRSAAIAEQEALFELEAGIPFRQVQRRSGRAKKKNAMSLDEKSEIINYVRGPKKVQR
ncbi:hypothetical protein F2P44_25985 [Massilia sp. CCM 8695]|uniref:Uncharacterized protein n=1 Tax=Massilia frigida TaxID=2609281 RepID=A0ABX0NHP2_9BURK|nr:hypothetical protein [Massilia frigida]